MSGVGKTTLAQVVYNHAEVKKHFQRRAWVYVSEHFSFKRTLQEILFSFNGYEDNGLDSCDSMEATITKLRSKICEGYKFVLVLDNVWEEICQQWSTLLTVLSDEAHQCGSVLLVTTQNQKVGQTIARVRPIQLKALPWESFWPLFQYYAFGGTEVAQQEDNRNMLSISREIAMKLDGLPLAAKVIGNLLRCRFSQANWRRVVDSDWWNLSDALQEILPYLRVSYQHLSPQQRQCFAFCSIFPRNYLFDKERIVQMWIAHDFIQRNNIADGIKPEDVGRQCFDVLVDRSLFQLTIVDNKYVMHDLVRGLAIAISVDQCFLHDERAGGASSQALENVRHLSLQTGSLEQCQELHKYKNLRTLLLFGRFESDAFFLLLDGMLRNSPSLRVLDLSYVEALGSGWPNNARSLRKLRFLDVSFTRITKFKDLPVNLQVLHLRGYDVDSLPQNITKLSNLRHLFVDNSALSNIPGIGQLTELQGLDSFIARKGQGFAIRELKNMQELTGQLCIRGLENVRSKD
ncbi:putative disease resistance protein RGA4 [Miscanthus floridulus]|uniref:putative disease resistance protein RGA4 n=1 Tax=Miscanthus floridulus TaxID=154761 RepID=UPI003459BB90